MANVLIEESTMSAIGNAIRSKTGKEELILPADMPSEIEGIEAGGGNDVLNALIDRSITEISDPNINTIGAYTFAYCVDLTEVNFQSATSIGRHSLMHCYKLLTINSPLVTTIDSHAFSNDTALKNVNFPLLKTVNESAFYKCTLLESADFPLATSVGKSAFQTCSNLKSVNMPLVTTLGTYAFQGCSYLTSVDFPLVTTIDSYNFGGCYKLETADFSSATKIVSSAFASCDLKELILRTTTKVCTLSNKNAFTNTQIESGTGYIYVPSALIEDYKVATNWSNYATQFRALEDYTVDGTVTGELDATKI